MGSIYGYTVVYRETKMKKFLRFAEKITDLYILRLPKRDYIPYWDFDDPAIPNAPKDASLIYADYYYLEALNRYKKMEKGLAVTAQYKK